MDNTVFLLLLVLFIGGMSFYIWSNKNGASFWSDYYAKEITKVINLAEPGDIITLDVHKATKIAIKSDISDYQTQTFSFNNENNEVCVKLAKGKQSCYQYFNNVDVINDKILPGAPINLLTFEIKSKPQIA